MGLETSLAKELQRAHPTRAAAVLDRLPLEEVARFMATGPAADAAAVLARLAPHHAAATLENLSLERGRDVLQALELRIASRLLRRLGGARQGELLDSLPAPLSQTLRAVLRFADNTAGALMDPAVLALPDDLTVEDALAEVREHPERTRYNVYVVDRSQSLVGVVNLRELLLANPQSRLSEVMVHKPSRLEAHADRSVVVAHPGWKEVHAIPVVDEEGCYLGAVRYRTLRKLEGELLDGAGVDANAADALGELFAAGAAGVLDALTGTGRRKD